MFGIHLQHFESADVQAANFIVRVPTIHEQIPNRSDFSWRCANCIQRRIANMYLENISVWMWNNMNETLQHKLVPNISAYFYLFMQFASFGIFNRLSVRPTPWAHIDLKHSLWCPRVRWGCEFQIFGEKYKGTVLISCEKILGINSSQIKFNI